MIVVERSTAEAYANLILREKRVLAEVVRRTVDFGTGTFVATVDFDVDDEGHWVISRDEARNARTLGGSQSDFRKRICHVLKPRLERPERLLIAEDWLITARRVLAGEAGLRRVVHRRVAGEVQDFVLVPGPVTDDESIYRAVETGSPHWQLGVVADLQLVDVEMPHHDSFVTTDDLRALASHVVAVYMRITSYDGHLVWLEDATEVGHDQDQG